MVDRVQGQLMVQEQSLQEPRKLEDLMLCTVKMGTPDFIDRNFCFRVIAPNSEHLFQAISETDMQQWISAIKEGIEETIKTGDTTVRMGGERERGEGGRGGREGGGEGGKADKIFTIHCLIVWQSC